MGTHRVLAPHAMHNWSLKSASSIYQQLKLTLTRISAAPVQAALLQASITRQIMLPSHCPPAKVRKMQIRIKPLIYYLCGE
jgi:hypothetical protein